MTTKVTVDVFQEINSEHLKLERQYAAFDAFLGGELVRVPVLRMRFSELAVILKCHFDHEEQGGYFEEIVEMAPRLSRLAQTLETEHDELLARLEYLDDQLSTTADVDEGFARLRKELEEFVAACRTHEHRETALMQEAWFTEIGTGD